MKPLTGWGRSSSLEAGAEAEAEPAAAAPVRKKMKSVMMVRVGQSDGRGNVAGFMGMTIGMF